MTFFTKDKREYSIKKEIISVDNKFCYESIKAFDKNNTEIAMLNYKINEEKSSAWLYYIGIEDESYLRQGIGHNMIILFEDELKSKGIKVVEGRFYPKGAGAKFAHDFYISHNYYIEKYDNCDIEIFKQLKLEKSKIKKSQVSNFL